MSQEALSAGMTYFSYKRGELFAEDVAIREIAAQVGTPFYCYSSAALETRYAALAMALPHGTLIAFSVKANGNIAVLRTLARLGAGADVVSGGELRKALAAGIPAKRIVFSGVGKTTQEMRLALEAGIHQFNVESEPEIKALNDVAASMRRVAEVAIRVNPDIGAGTHAKITTGTAENKFGVPIGRASAACALVASLPSLKLVGVDVHIGSQIVDIGPFTAAFERVMELVRQLRADGHRIERIDFGGGLGVPYRKENSVLAPGTYAALIARIAAGADANLIVEPGRLIAAEAGVLVASVIYIKSGGARTFAILDAGMNDLIRPALYGAYHEIVPVREMSPRAPLMRYDIVGPICESSDSFATDRELPSLAAGDMVAIMSAGAYGAVMASAYNARPPAPEVLVKESRFSVVRPRLDDDALVRQERIPDWLQDPAG